MEEFALQVQNILGKRLSISQLNIFLKYEEELLAWNQIRIKHFLDSLTCLKAIRSETVKSVIDVGTGAGFPGIPLKIVLPGIQLTLVESIAKKAEFCQHIINDLGLDNVLVFQQRVEDIGQKPDHREHYDIAIGRAVANMPVLAEYLLPLVRVGGSMLAMKGENAPVEAHNSEHAFQILGGRLRKLIPVILPGVVEERYIVIVDKVAGTPPTYPRRVGIPAKKPLA
jgi:16S rRNA (guanine527-N7)-methyltransferase